MPGEQATDRQLLEISGPDRVDFLQGLVTNYISPETKGLIYAALLSPQGKYLADFFLALQPDHVLLDVHASIADDLIRRLGLYKLRAKVAFAASPLQVQRGLGALPPGALADPRHPSLGWRVYGFSLGSAPLIDWDALRVAACIPETGIELIPEASYILEAGFERLNGVDFRKGCYVGQEVTARMKHKIDLRKGLTSVRLSGAVPVGTQILAGDRQAGTVFTQSGGRGIAYLRFDRADGPLMAGMEKVMVDQGS